MFEKVVEEAEKVARRYTREEVAMRDPLNVVEDGKVWVKYDLPASFPCPDAEIDILRRVEDALVEIADRIEEVAAEEPAGGDGVIHFGDCGERESRVRIVLRNPAPENDGRNLPELTNHGGKTAYRVLHSPVGEEELRREDADGEVPAECLEKRPQVAIEERGVGVHHADDVAPAFPKRRVAGAGRPPVLREPDEFDGHTRSVLLDDAHRAVGRAIVHHEYLVVDPLAAANRGDPSKAVPDGLF